jgi:hypothetical protein
MVPRFSIHNVFSLKEEMDATNWGDILLATAKDWAVPDVIENSDTYKKLTAQGAKQVSLLEQALSALVSKPAAGAGTSASYSCDRVHGPCIMYTLATVHSSQANHNSACQTSCGWLATLQQDV